MHVNIILVEPQLAENLGAVARVMGNFDQVNLRLVSPKVSPNDDKAIAMAVSSKAILETAEIFSTFSDAVADCRTIIGTTAQPRQLIKYYHTPKDLSAHIFEMQGPIALVFGPERTGLNNDIIALCTALVRIPVNLEYSSLNLSHAAAILLYELFSTRSVQNAFWQKGITESATSQSVDSFLSYLESMLDKTHFWRTASKKTGMKRNIFGMFKRQQWFEQDLKTLRGVIDAIRKSPNP